MNWLLIRLTAPLAAISVFVFVLAATAAWYVSRLETEQAEVLSVHVDSVRAAGELEIGLREVRAHLKEYKHTGDRAQLDEAARLGADTARWLGEAERLATTPPEQELIRQVRQGYDRFLAQFDRLLRAEGEDRPAVPELCVRAEQLLTDEVLPPAHLYLELNEEMTAQTAARTRTLGGRMTVLVLFLGASGSAAGLLACYGVARRLNRSIAQLGAPLLDAAGKLSAAAGGPPPAAGRDFEELEAALQKVAEQAGRVVARLHHSEREVLRSEQLAAVGQMAAGLAHELRNPLMAMKVLVQPAAEIDASVSLNQDDLAVLNEEIVRLEGSIQAFLDFARPPQPEKRPFEAATVARQAAHLVAARAEQRGVCLECRAHIPVVVEADMIQFRQVLLNLLLNALDATGEGGNVRLELASRPGPDGRLLVLVADTGCGLPAELGQRIFEPFVSTKDTGMGLGLSICKRIVEAHGGTIAAAGRPGGGTVFTVQLPLHANSTTGVPTDAEVAHRG